MLDIATILDLAQKSTDDEYYDKAYSMMAAIAGDTSMVDRIGSIPSHTGGSAERLLKDYGPISIPIQGIGIQNHMGVNARIAVQNVVYADPAIRFTCEDPIIKQVNEAWVKSAWLRGDWSSAFYAAGMELEASGTGFVELGVRDGAVDLVHHSVLDVLWDKVGRMPSEWAYFFTRRRIPMWKAVRRFGMLLGVDRIKELGGRISMSTESLGSGEEPDVIIAWSFWTEDCHCMFLGDPLGDHEVLIYNEELQLVPSKIMGGPNPFGVVPVQHWVDNWSPGVLRPTSKAETSFRNAKMLNALEMYVRDIVRTGGALTLISALGLSEDQIDEIKNSECPSEVVKILLIENMAEVNNMIQRVPASEIPPSVLQALGLYQERMNAASSVQEMQRGNAVSDGDTTATEIRSLVNMQGVQARHARRQYANFLHGVIYKARAIGAMFETAPSKLPLRDGRLFDTEVWPLQPFLAYQMDVHIDEDSLLQVSEDERRNQRLMEFQMIDMPAIQMGIGDPMKIFSNVYSSLGIDPKTRLMSEEDMAMMQAQAMMGGNIEGEGQSNDDASNQQGNNA